VDTAISKCCVLCGAQRPTSPHQRFISKLYIVGHSIILSCTLFTVEMSVIMKRSNDETHLRLGLLTSLDFFQCLLFQK
jgi:hypothetical protein